MNYIEIGKEVLDIEISGMNTVKENLSDDFSGSVNAILNTKGRVVITGMGKSGIVGKKIAATLASTGTRSFFVHPGEAYHGDLGMIHSEDVVVAISNSGETEEVIKILSFLKENQNTVIAITAKRESTLAKYSDYFLNISIPKEACPLELAPTTSTTVTMAMGDMIAVALMKAKGFKPENFAKFHPGGSLGRKLLTKTSDLMITKNLPILTPETEFDDILAIISKGRLGIGVVLNNEKISGIITDGDIRRLLREKKEKALEMKASDFAINDPVVISPNERIVEAEEIMQERKITILLVAENNKLEGILHRYDI